MSKNENRLFKLATSVIIATLIFVMSLPLTASAASFSWVMNECGQDGCITSWTGTLPADVVIPATVNGQKVTGLGPALFSANKTIKTVIISEGITEIGGKTNDGDDFGLSFTDCYNLQKVTLPSTMKLIKDASFCGCKSLSSINIPNGVTRIGIEAFRECKSLRNINVPSSVKYIGIHAFTGCSNATITFGGNPELGGNIFENHCGSVTGNLTIKAPEGSSVLEVASSQPNITIADNTQTPTTPSSNPITPSSNPTTPSSNPATPQTSTSKAQTSSNKTDNTVSKETVTSQPQNDITNSINNDVSSDITTSEDEDDSSGNTAFENIESSDADKATKDKSHDNTTKGENNHIFIWCIIGIIIIYASALGFYLFRKYKRKKYLHTNI